MKESSERIELAIWKEIAGRHMSVSHDRWHLDHVLQFAYALQEIYGGDREVLTAAALMHDLGRGDKKRAHGKESIEASTEEASKILKSINYPEDKTREVLMAIAEHDQPEITPSTIEGRILKDADFLSGFGAWGILRVAMWSGESGRNVSVLLGRLERGMAKRVASLEFPESARLARQEMLFAKLFLSELKRPAALRQKPKKGLYIILDGIGGSGKDTQAEILQEQLERHGHKTLKVGEPYPNGLYRELRDAWEEKHGGKLDDPVLKKALLIVDRHKGISEEVWPALDEGKVVISVRSFVSTMVYQCEDDYERAVRAYEHRFVPQPDLVLLLDLAPEIALDRIVQRDKKRGDYEKRELLAKHRSIFREVCEQYFGDQLHVIDAARSVEDIAEKVWEVFEPLCEKLPRLSHDGRTLETLKLR